MNDERGLYDNDYERGKYYYRRCGTSIFVNGNGAQRDVTDRMLYGSPSPSSSPSPSPGPSPSEFGGESESDPSEAAGVSSDAG